MKRRMTAEEIETAQVEQVFSLDGGELDREPWILAETFDAEDGHQRSSPYTWGYTYQGIPEWAREDFPSLRHYCGQVDGDFMTVIDLAAVYSSPPGVMVQDDGAIWVKVASYANSGERPCPFQDWDPVNGEDGQHRKVSRQEAQLTPKPEVRREPSAYIVGNRDDFSARRIRPNARRGECPLCEARVGEEHGYVYLGACAEVVYEAVGHVRGKGTAFVVEVCTPGEPVVTLPGLHLSEDAAEVFAEAWYEARVKADPDREDEYGWELREEKV